MYNDEDGLTVLKPSHDAATVHWGDGWRMPTKEEMEALLRLTKGWTAQDGVNGYRFTGNGNSIFLPAAGHFNDEGYVSGFNTAGCYWTSNLDSSCIVALIIIFNGNNASFGKDLRSYGCSIRPVRTL
jgi:hypothetical protein